MPEKLPRAPLRRSRTYDTVCAALERLCALTPLLTGQAGR
jgi:hypothetical protein